MKQEYAFVGIIAAAVMNFSMSHPEKQVSPMDFIPEQYLTSEEKKLPFERMSPEEQGAFVLNEMRKRIYRRK